MNNKSLTKTRLEKAIEGTNNSYELYLFYCTMEFPDNKSRWLASHVVEVESV